MESAVLAIDDHLGVGEDRAPVIGRLDEVRQSIECRLGV